MEFSLRRSSSHNSSHGSPPSFDHHNSFTDDICNHPGCSGVVRDDSPSGENHSIFSRHHRHHTHDAGVSRNPMARVGPGQGEVIVKIDSIVNVDDDTHTTTTATSTTKESSNDVAGNNSSVWRRGSSGEFSFPRPHDDDHEINKLSRPEDPVSNLMKVTQEEGGTLMLDMDLDIEKLQQQKQHDHLRQGGLPPLAPDSSRSKTIHSPDFSTSYKAGIIHNQNNHYHTPEGSKEIRVSFQESLTSDHMRRQTSMYSTIEKESSSYDSSSENGDDDEHHNKDENQSGEFVRCNSNNNTASFRRMPSMSNPTRAKSRLVDPAPVTPLDQRSGGMPRSSPITRSGLLGKSSMVDEEEDDPFCDDDLPDELKSGKFSIVVLLEWLSLVMMIAALVCSLIFPVLREKTLWNLKLWKWEVLVLVLICGRLVSDWGIRILVFFIERNLLLRKRLLYFVCGLKKAVQNVIWLALVLLTWHFLFDSKVEKQARSEPIKIVTKLLVIGEVGSVLWLLKTLLVKVCASTFHVKAFFDRVQESLFNQFVIETLSAPPLFDLTHPPEEDDKATMHAFPCNNSGSANATPCKSPLGQSTRHSEPLSKKLNEGITIDYLHRMNPKNISAWNMKRLIKIIRHGALTTLDDQLVENPNLGDDTATQIRSEVEAKAAAKKIFRNVAKPHYRHIYLEDMMRFMKEDEAIKTMSLFEGAIENERISRRALRNWVVNAFRERRALAFTLSDTKSAVNKLHKMMTVLVSGIILLIGATYLNIISSDYIIFLTSQIVVVAFVFGNTCKNVFESIIFLFVIHPFDVGDRCEIDGVQMVVEEINILTTVFLRFDNQKIIFPNYVLVTKAIGNFKRSPDMGDAVELCFHISTPAEKIAVMRQRISNYIEHKKEHWYPSPMIVLKDAENLHMLRIAVWLQHRMNHQDMGERYLRRALLIEECIKIFRDIDIEYRIYPINVNINSMPPISYAHAPPPMLNNALLAEGGREVVHS